MDLEEQARTLFRKKKDKDEIITELEALAGSKQKAEAIFNEICFTENIEDPFIAEICNFKVSKITAASSGLGCRGEGDFLVHHKISELINNSDTEIGPEQQDDAGVVKQNSGYIAVAVDGMHSRLSHFPFIAGFHVARAAIRDIIVMGCEPKAIFSDIHLANDGDVAKVFDYTAGISTVSELLEIPFVAGSTLRIGGDLVGGDRLTGCAGCVGYGNTLTPRIDAAAGDVLIMTEGSGGGTIATTALYNGYSEVVKETLDLKIINLGLKLLNSDFLSGIHSITDVTNGGLRGDAFEISRTAGVRITIFKDRFYDLIDPKVLDLLRKLDIDPLGVSIDSYLIILPPVNSEKVLGFIRNHGIRADIIGRIEYSSLGALDHTPGVQLIDNIDLNEMSIEKLINIELDKSKIIELTPNYREAPYTPIKKIVDVDSKTELSSNYKNKIDVSVNTALEKKKKMKDWLWQKDRI